MTATPTSSTATPATNTVAAAAASAARQPRGKSHARQLLRSLAGAKNILITTHEHADPDALGSCLALCNLLDAKLGGATKVSVSIKGRFGGGVNDMFAQLANLKPLPWDESSLAQYDAIVLLDTQPTFSNNPLPPGLMPVAVIDHHRSRGRRAHYTFSDIRPDVGATGSIVFSYFLELGHPISRDLAATLLFAIESDLAGAAGTPGELDNLALSSLTLVADTRKLYRMRYAPLPQSYYAAYAQGIGNAMYHEDALISHLEPIDSPEKPAVLADFLLRFDKVLWALVTAVIGKNLVLSLRTNSTKISAAEIMKRLVRTLGEGGGHRTKAGGVIKLANGTPTEIDRVRATIKRRYLRALKIPQGRGQKLVPKSE
jgi:nanoRNase/pAp phosphatase (c-di-AMP/oligoRNAs hydrolase)